MAIKWHLSKWIFPLLLSGWVGYTSAQTTNQSLQKPKRGTSPGDTLATLSYTPGENPEFWSIALAETIMARYPDYRTAYWKDYTYVQGYMFQPMFWLWEITGNSKYLDYIKTYIDHYVDEEGKYKGGGLTNLDNFMTGSAFCCLYNITKEEKYKKAASYILSKVKDYPSSDGQFWHGNKKPDMWVDGVFMMQMFLIRYAQYIGQEEYCLNIACENIISAARHLQRSDGLLLHAWTTEPENAVWANKETGLSPEVWSEGMGWYMLITAEILPILSKNHSSYETIHNIYLAAIEGLLKYQDKKEGGWYMVVDKPNETGNFIDASGTAMFVYSIQNGIKHNLLKGKKYQKAAEKGFHSLENHMVVNPRGLVDIIEVCDGVTVKKNYEGYISVPKMINAKEAVAGAAWAAFIIEEKRLQDKFK